MEAPIPCIELIKRGPFLFVLFPTCYRYATMRDHPSPIAIPIVPAVKIVDVTPFTFYVLACCSSLLMGLPSYTCVYIPGIALYSIFGCCENRYHLISLQPLVLAAWNLQKAHLQAMADFMKLLSCVSDVSKTLLCCPQTFAMAPHEWYRKTFFQFLRSFPKKHWFRLHSHRTPPY